MEKILLKTRNTNEIVAVDDILRIEADGNYSIIYVKDITIRTSKKISYYELKLKDYDFIRIHNSHLVNSKKIKAVRFGKTMLMHLENDSLLPISNSYKKRLSQRLSEEYKKV